MTPPERGRDEAPLRAELLSIAQLQRYARTLAEWHEVGEGSAPDRLLARLDENEEVLAHAYALLTEAVARGCQVTPAAEWLIDNYHLIEEQIRTARCHLPRGYADQLPRLLNVAASPPRVYTLALELISHAHGRVDLESVTTFVMAYQAIAPLRLGEPWAIPIMLRLALIENLRRVVASVVAGRRDRERAGARAGALLDVGASDPSRVVLVLAEMVQEDPELTDAFVAELASRVQGHGAAMLFPMTWLEQRVQARGQTLDQVFQLVSQSQAADQVSIGNCIGSLRFLGATDWRDVVEATSVVEEALRRDPVYPATDFQTRDRYRHVVERVARASARSELEVAEAALALSREAHDERGRHVGYFLVDDGLDALERAVRARRGAWRLVRRLGARVGVAAYVGAIAGIAAAIAIPLAWSAVPAGGLVLALWSAVAVLAAGQVALALVHWAAALLVPPRVLPRLDFTEGIPDAHRTLVAVPTMLTSLPAIDELVADLEVRFLANRDPNLGFALITDFVDAPEETVERGQPLLDHASAAIEALGVRYAQDSGLGFFLFHRAQRWNASEGVWMGWERKRGKLEELNRTLRGEAGRFASVVGPTERLVDVRYVIALDSDTELPRDAARALAATLGHPLNRPVVDAAVGRVTEGYAILQPRVGSTLASSQTSRYARLFAGECGIDPYTRAVSDVYQDAFGEGSFIGKGIYDIDAMQAVLSDRLPDNRILSHDLLEGAYARSALVSDVILFEDFPSSYALDACRRARWMRGDWQIARWLFGAVPGPRGRARNPISLLSRWKIFDNLRRSVLPTALVTSVALAGAVPSLAGPALGLVLATLFVPNVLSALSSAARRPVEVPRGQHLAAIAQTFRRQLLRDALSFACLPYDAALGLGAIGRVGVRLLFTHHHLLEWRTAADAQRAARTSLAGVFAAMWASPAIPLALAVGLAVARPEALVLAMPVLASWALAPLLVWWIGRPLVRRAPRVSTSDVAFLRGVARQTWRFFEKYVGPEDHDLPPDNVQEDPPVGVAHRTSPTNIGLALLANLAAYDFGYATADLVVARITRTLATMDRLGRYRGHFYNWYDTRTLEPLRPMYVSTVDSGNLAGHLLTLAAGLEALSAHGVVRPELLSGLGDTLARIEDEAASRGAPLDVSVVRALLEEPPVSLSDWRARLARLVAAAGELARATADRTDSELSFWIGALERECARAHDLVRDLASDGADRVPTLAELGYGAELGALAARCRAFSDVDYELLYDRGRQLLAVGYNVLDHRLDASYYDLLASEARLASFVAIAQGKLPQEHWFSLGRRLTTTTGGQPALLSWSGSMFEYLMPLLVMPAYEGTLLDATYRAVVARQVEHGRTRGVAWGVSESGFNETDAQLNYQYRAFGVAGLGFKRGLADDLVIAPYASALGLMVDAELACANLRRLAVEGRLGAYGFYEAIDHTPSRLPPGKTSVTVRSYMAHHQGMTLLALAHPLLGRPMQRRFEADPSLRATALLLQERVPKTLAIHPHPADLSAVRVAPTGGEPDARILTTPSTPFPEVHLLSNGSYHVAVTAAGGGYSRWRELAVTRWQEDPTRDAFGTFVYLRDVATGSFWSVAHQPTLQPAASYEAIFSQGRAELRRRDGDLYTHVEISVSPEDDIELRRISLSNFGRTARTIELTTYAEVVLALPAADAAHRTFSNLFVETELVREHRAILCTRRPRSPGETPPWMIHLMTVCGPVAGDASYETDRAAFIGRGRSTLDPAAMHQASLGDREGAVLDPIVSIRSAVEIGSDQTIQIHVVTGVAETREGALALIEKYSERHVADRVLELAWTQCQVLQRRLEASSSDIVLYDRLAGNILYGNPSLRAPRDVIARNRLGQSGLWAYGISGDLPIVLVRVADAGHLPLVQQMVAAHGYWRVKGLAVDLVIWNEDPSGYRQDVHERILGLIAKGAGAALLDRPGGIFVRRSDQLSEDDNVLTRTIARVIVEGAGGSLAAQLERRPRDEVTDAPFVRRERRKVPRDGSEPYFPFERRRAARPRIEPASAPIERTDLAQWNGLGGFTRDGREYVIVTTATRRTPLPWVNVLANPYFGTVVSESGGAYTWCENAHAHRLTPWVSDAVADASGENVYVRDEEDGSFWSPTPLPCTGPAPYTTRHGFGYTVFETTQAGITSELTTFVAMNAPVKFLLLRLENTSQRPRRVSLTSSFELVLGSQRPANAPHILTEIDAKTGALMARNPYGAEFAPRVAFLDASEPQRTVTADRGELLGRNGHPSRPACMTRARLAGRVGARLDPCLAMQVGIELAPGESREVSFMFGSGRDLADARHIVERFRGVGGARAALEEVWEHWKRTLGAVHVETPDRALDFLANGWLLYQVISARMWGRSGFSQSGGAFGFRDQLQDAMALLHAEPALLREQILRAAARQFPQGDVQHWWHPPLGRGVRTRISDDYLWLPYAVCRYVAGTGDTGVLEESIPFVEGRPVKDDEDSYYDLPTRAVEAETLYQHCVRAIDHGLRFGAHGLPFMGSGDWNDGMNLVGDLGEGESVWLGFFLYDVLVQFAALAVGRGDATYADSCRASAGRLERNLEAHGWDGAWYLRAFFDDGTPLGSASSPECQIDSLPQSWAVLAGVGDPERQRAGLAAIDARLVDRELGLIKLFDPPFDRSALEPGYVKGYVPGVRENGGQYTHAAVWATMAFAEAGQIEKAWELFDLINPLGHGGDARAIERYRAEPYVVAADVYTSPQHAGRGGWTWYTGSAAWMYRLIVESLLGLRLEVDRLHVRPRLPASWPGFTVHYRHGETVHHIEVKRRGPGATVTRVTCDGVVRESLTVVLHRDRIEHWCVVELGDDA